MRILQCIDTLNPALGGTVESTSQMAVALGECGASVEILCLDKPDEAYDCNFHGAIHRVGPHYTSYGYAPGLSKWLRMNLKQYDVAIINGVWRYHSTGVWSVARTFQSPYYLVPHSMLNPWFREAFPVKNAKKTLLWRLSEHKTLRYARAVIYTSEEERRLSSGSFKPYCCREVVVPLGTADPIQKLNRNGHDLWNKYPHMRGKRILLFLGRLHPMKACDLLIKSFAEIASEYPDLHLVLAGPDSVGWRSDLESQASLVGVASRITFTGPVYGDEKWNLLRNAEVFLLPSHCEAFPYSILEALASSLPVVTTTKVNIYRDLAEFDCAFIGEDTTEATVRSLKRWLSLSAEAKSEMRRRSRKCFTTMYHSRSAAKRLLNLFQSDLSFCHSGSKN